MMQTHRPPTGRRRFLIGALACAPALLMACGPAAVPSAPPAAATTTAPAPTAPNAPSTTTPAPAPAATAAATPVAKAPASSAPAKVIFWHYNAPPQSKILEDLAAEFAQTRPGLTIDVLSVPGNEIVQKVQAAVAGKVGPDVAYADTPTVPTYWKAGVIRALDDLIRADGIGMDDFYDGHLQYSSQAGKWYGLPFESNMQFLAWNKTLFEKNGLDPEKPPATWEELVDIGLKLTNPEQRTLGYQLRAIDAKDGIGRLAFDMSVLIWMQDGHFLRPDGQRRLERGWPDFNNDLGVTAWQYQIDLVQKHKISSLNPPANAFQAGLLGMSLITASGTKNLREAVEPRFKMGVTKFPPRQKPAAVIGGAQLTLFTEATAPEQAWAFIAHMTSPAIALKWGTLSGFPVARKSVQEGADYQRWVQENPDYKVAGELLPFLKPRPPVTFANELLNRVAIQMEPALYGQIDVKKSLDNAANAVNDVFKENNYNPDRET